MSRQRFQTLPSFHIPYPHALVKLGRGGETNINVALSLSHGVSHLLSIRNAAGAATHRSRHDEIRLGVEVAAEDVVAVTFERFQALALDQRHSSTDTEHPSGSGTETEAGKKESSSATRIISRCFSASLAFSHIPGE